MSSLWNPVTAGAALPTLAAAGTIVSVVTPTDYEDAFGAYTQDDNQIQRILDRATQRCEDYCKRPLRMANWTERLRITYDAFIDPLFGMAGTVYPRAVPVWQSLNPAGSQVVDHVEIRYVPPDDLALSFFPVSGAEMYGTVTYQGGWTHESLPGSLREVICKIGNRMLRRQGGQSDLPEPGVSSVRVGDVSVGYGSGGGTPGSWLDESDEEVLDGYVYRTI